MDCHFLFPPGLPQLFFVGPPIEHGPLPAFFYFFTSGDESLLVHPSNQPVLPFIGSSARVFSLTLPGHGPGFDKLIAMDYWFQKLQEDPFFIDHFIEEIKKIIEWLIEENIVDPKLIGAGGLSRGGFIATHLAAKVKEIHYLLGFAPLTQLKSLYESRPYQHEDSFQQTLNRLNLSSLIPELLHVRHVRFYIGNRDTRVNTDACYHFIRDFVEATHEARIRQCFLELFIIPSIGHKGHGTSPATFEEGGRWIKNLLTLG